VGFPIRKFTDQSLFAAPHDLSQRTTSFIASQRQGIHRIPLRHLIALIIDAHRSARRARPSPKIVRWLDRSLLKTSCFKHIRGHCGQACPLTEDANPCGNPARKIGYVSSSQCQKNFGAKPKSHANSLCTDDPMLGAAIANVWWSQTGSNRRPHACKARALPTELWPRQARNATMPGRSAKLAGQNRQRWSGGPGKT
jgi:hypothetical protein